MGRSLAKTTDPPVEDDITAPRFTTPPGVRLRNRISYRVERQENAVLHHEILTAGDGEVIYDHAVPVHFAVGSGQRGRSYLTNRDGLLFMSPITWYSTSAEWDLSPGYEVNNQHFQRRIVDGCLSCHAGRVNALKDAPDRYGAEPFFEKSIGCENCHGPAEGHVAFHREDGSVAGDTIVNPADLTMELQNHLCFQCHLTGEHRETRYGRTHFDFRPGNRLTDVWAIVVAGTGVDRGGATEAVSQVEQMLSSVCYQRSDGALGCVSCHDPHRLPAAEERTEFYRAQCLECHGPESTPCGLPESQRLEIIPGDSCIDCHMGRIAANDVPHTSQTDHRILRSPQSSPAAGTGSVKLQIFGADEISEAERNRAIALSLVWTAEQTGNPVMVAEAIPMLERWLAAAPDDLEAQRSLGIAYWLMSDLRMAGKSWEAGLAASPYHEYFLRRLFVLYHDTDQLELAAEHGRKLTELNPWDYEYAGRLSHVLGGLGELEEAAKMGEHALSLNPASVQLNEWLAEVYDSLGLTTKRDEHVRQAAMKVQ